MDSSHKSHVRNLLHDLVNQVTISEGLSNILLKVERGEKEMPLEEKIKRLEKITFSLKKCQDLLFELKKINLENEN
jgi:hypothetical protein